MTGGGASDLRASWFQVVAWCRGCKFNTWKRRKIKLVFYNILCTVKMKQIPGKVCFGHTTRLLKPAKLKFEQSCCMPTTEVPGWVKFKEYNEFCSAFVEFQRGKTLVVGNLLHPTHRLG